MEAAATWAAPLGVAHLGALELLPIWALFVLGVVLGQVRLSCLWRSSGAWWSRRGERGGPDARDPEHLK